MIAFMSIALLVALFLLNSDRIQKAIEISRECLILLNSTDQNSKDQFNSVLRQFYIDIYTLLFNHSHTLPLTHYTLFHANHFAISTRK